MAEVPIPEKLTFKRKEVIRLTKLDGKVLDFWEREFGAFSPVVNREGEKFYTHRDVELILKIKKWLIQEKKEKKSVCELLNLEIVPNGESPFRSGTNRPSPDTLNRIKSELKEILTLIDKSDNK